MITVRPDRLFEWEWQVPHSWALPVFETPRTQLSESDPVGWHAWAMFGGYPMKITRGFPLQHPEDRYR